MRDLIQDIRFAIRTLLRSPGYTAITLLTLALGIGATTAIFSLVNGVLLRPLPYPESDRLVRVWELNDVARPMNGAWRNIKDWRTAGSFDGLVGVGQWGKATVLGAGEPVRVGVSAVSEGFFATIGVQPVVGRGFLAEEHRQGAAPAVVVSDGFWRTDLGADPDLGATHLNISGMDVRIVGVMPAGFDYPGDVDIWFPLELVDGNESRTSHNYIVLGRLADGVTVEQAKAELDAITAGFAESAGEDITRYASFFPFAARVTPLQESVVGDTRRPLWILLAASAMLLLVACTNLAGAALARGTRRGRELAVRQALGAGRGRVARQLFTESLTLALPGAALGVVLAFLALRTVPALAPAALPRLDAVRLDGVVLAFTLLTAVLTAVVFGLLPGLRATRGDTASTLRSGRGAGHGPGQRRAWRWLVAAEVAVAVVLLVGCGLLIRSFITVLNVEPGFRTENLLLATLSPPAVKYADGPARRAFYDEVARELEALPGVAGVGLTSRPPLSGAANGQIQVRNHDDVTADYHVVDTGYFRTLDIPLLQGRLFDGRDREDTEHAVVVNQAFADMAWPGEDPLGRQITAGGMDNYWNQEKWATVVGVVADIHQRDLTRAPEPAYYFSYRQRPYRTSSMTAVIRPGRGRATALAALVRDAVRRVDADVPVGMQTIEERVAVAVADRRFTMAVLGIFATVALVLACVGIYGVVAYTVAQRTREIGIRVALGADPGSVRRFVQRDSSTGVAAGAAAGVVLALAVTRLMASLLYETSPTDPLTFALVLVALGAAAWIAAFLPARRGARLDPIEAIRTE